MIYRYPRDTKSSSELLKAHYDIETNQTREKRASVDKQSGVLI